MIGITVCTLISLLIIEDLRIKYCTPRRSVNDMIKRLELVVQLIALFLIQHLKGCTIPFNTRLTHVKTLVKREILAKKESSVLSHIYNSSKDIFLLATKCFSLKDSRTLAILNFGNAKYSFLLYRKQLKLSYRNLSA